MADLIATARRFRPCITDGMVQVLHGQNGTMTSPEHYSLYHLTDGRLRSRRTGRRRWHHHLGPAVFLLAPGHELAYDAGSRFRSISFTNDGDDDLTLPPTVPDHLTGRTERLILLWSDRWWRSDRDLFQCTMELGLWVLDLTAPAQPPGKAEAQDPWLKDLRRCVADLLPHGPKAADLARGMGISRASLYRRLSTLGTTAGQVIDAVRRETAYELLRHGEWRVSGVARMCGFPSSTIFSRWFKSQTDLTPTAWRREHIPGFTPATIGTVTRRQLGGWDQRQRYP